MFKLSQVFWCQSEIGLKVNLCFRCALKLRPISRLRVDQPLASTSLSRRLKWSVSQANLGELNSSGI